MTFQAKAHIKEHMDIGYYGSHNEEELAELELDKAAAAPQYLRKSRMPMIKEVMLTASTASVYSTYNIKSKSTDNSAICAVCGDGHAKLHYGILACYGCKGFFRRTLTGKYRYICRFGNNCIVDKYQRNSCRYCRFQRCLEVGMDPKAVRPDRDLTGRQRVPRSRKRQIDGELLSQMQMRLESNDWSRKLPVESRVLLMQLINIESKVVEEDKTSFTRNNAKDTPKNVSLGELFEQKPMLNGRRTEVLYESYRMARTDELPQIAHCRVIAAVDWVDSLARIAGITTIEDKVALVKSCCSPLTVFNFSAHTAQKTENPDILCLCSFLYVPRRLPNEFSQTNHLSDDLIDRILNELVTPMRKLHLKEEEVMPLKAVIILNPNAKGLSRSAQQTVSNLRDRVQEMLFHVVRELHPSYTATSRFGSLLLLLPTIMTLSGIMSEKLQFVQDLVGRQNGDHLLGQMFSNVCSKLNESVISTSSPPVLQNPAEISLQSVSSLQQPTVTMNSTENQGKLRMDSTTQTDLDETLKGSLSSSSFCKPLTSPSHVSLSPFQNLLDDDLADYSPAPDYSDIHNDCGDYFFLMDDIR